ncbi:hypothetical protein FE810_13375 [Thalassotalea litorea]|uniref:Glycosyltransferase family 2 protein n=1 Tax=Thalassotalea litorea TaxID=2020715 RepID=A0A5R9IDX4_9GAMM|nr:hypothetical protein [Thalassotalea litorea]TLU61806.1 hypothetical protein FE810_13375 [Thalassotalea litorea]
MRKLNWISSVIEYPIGVQARRDNLAIDKTFSKYLANFAEPEVTRLASFPQTLVFAQVVILPAYKESAEFCHRFNIVTESQQDKLLIVVINQPDTDMDIEPQRQLFEKIDHIGDRIWQCENLSLLQLKSGSFVLVVDRFTQPIPHKQGVGLARKIAADLACQLISQKQIQSPWVYSTDADAHLPENYFSTLANISDDTRALVFGFYHQAVDSIEHQQEGAATHLYELSMRYYVAGLSYAGSPYNFFTIGSILAFCADAYVKVRGFPKRAAGEDFYLLNKIAKLGKIKNEQSVQIKIDARVSDRVPFGTGPAVEKIINLQQNKQDYCYYQPQVFVELKQLLDAMNTSAGNLEELAIALQDLSAVCSRSLADIGFADFLDKLGAQSISSAQVNRQLRVWFDAFKTLKFIHALRDNGLPDIPLQQALNNPHFTTV